MRIIFFGTPEFAAHILEALVKAKVDIVAVVTKPDTPQGRHLVLTAPAVKTMAQNLLPQVPILQPAKCSCAEVIEELGNLHADLYVVVAYGEILSQNLLDSAPLGAINVHASLLPRYRGAAPIQRAIMHGEKETGISIIRLVRKMDAGDILHAESIAITPTMNGGELESQLCELGKKCLLKVLDDFKAGKVQAVKQDETLVTFADKIVSNDTHMDWNRPAIELYNLVRALSPYPGAWCEVLVRGEKKRLKVFSAEIVDAPNKNALIVPCATGYLKLVTIQLEGKPKVSVVDLLRGIPASHITFCSE